MKGLFLGVAVVALAIAASAIGYERVSTQAYRHGEHEIAEGSRCISCNGTGFYKDTSMNCMSCRGTGRVNSY